MNDKLYISLVKKGESLEMTSLSPEDAKRKWGGDGYKHDTSIIAPDGKVFKKTVYRIIIKADLAEWSKAVNHHMEHGA